MSRPSRPRLPTVLVLGLLALGLAGCATSIPQLTPPPAPAPALPPAFPPQDIVGRWGLAAYHRDGRPRRAPRPPRRPSASSLTSSRSVPPAG